MAGTGMNTDYIKHQISTSIFKRQHMRNPGTDGNLNILNINKFTFATLYREFITKHDEQVST